MTMTTAPARSPFHVLVKPTGPICNLRSAGRDDPCPCGSGRTAKQCHSG